jgi:hypothetical protein
MAEHYGRKNVKQAVASFMQRPPQTVHPKLSIITSKEKHPQLETVHAENRAKDGS